MAERVAPGTLPYVNASCRQRPMSGRTVGKIADRSTFGADALPARLVGTEVQLRGGAAVDAEVGQVAAADARAVGVHVQLAVASRGDDEVDEPARRQHGVGRDVGPEAIKRTWPSGVRSISKPSPSPPPGIFQSHSRR
jgi:hypothetical protein